MNKTKPKAGIYENLDFKDYQAIDALNSGRIRHSMKSLKYMRRQELTPQAEYNYIFEVGKAFAYLCEDPELYRQKCRQGPTKTAGTIKWMAELEENPGTILLTEDDWLTLPEMRKACVEEVVSAPLFDKTQLVRRELSFVWQCERTGVWLKGRADFVLDDWLVDVKTCQSVYKTAWQIRDFRYDMQLAMYQDGLRHNGISCTRVSNLFVEKERIMPEVVVKDFQQQELADAWDDYILAIQNIDAARKSGVYTGYKFPVYEQDELSGFSE